MGTIKYENNYKQVMEAYKKQKGEALNEIGRYGKELVVDSINIMDYVDTTNLRSSITYQANNDGAITGSAYSHKGPYADKHGSGGNGADLSPKMKKDSVGIGTSTDYAIYVETTLRGSFMNVIVSNAEDYREIFEAALRG